MTYDRSDRSHTIQNETSNNPTASILHRALIYICNSNPPSQRTNNYPIKHPPTCPNQKQHIFHQLHPIQSLPLPTIHLRRHRHLPRIAHHTNHQHILRQFENRQRYRLSLQHQLHIATIITLYIRSKCHMCIRLQLFRQFFERIGFRRGYFGQ